MGAEPRFQLLASFNYRLSSTKIKLIYFASVIILRYVTVDSFESLFIFAFVLFCFFHSNRLISTCSGYVNSV